MDRKVLKPLIVVFLSIFVVMLSIRCFSVKEEVSKLDKVIKQYENNLINQDSYLSESLHMNIELEENNGYSVITFSSKEVELEDVIIIVSNKEECMSYGIKDSVGTDFVIADFDSINGDIKGVRLIFDVSDEYFIYVSYIIENEIIEEFIHIN